jgi:hypothetical protein
MILHAELLASKEESAQYILHAVGLVFDQSNKRLIVGCTWARILYGVCANPLDE